MIVSLSSREVHRVARVEGALDAGDAGRQQAGVPRSTTASTAPVSSAGCRGPPRRASATAAGSRAAAVGREVGADRLAGQRRGARWPRRRPRWGCRPRRRSWPLPPWWPCRRCPGPAGLGALPGLDARPSRTPSRSAWPRTSAIRWAAPRRGSPSYRPSTSESRISALARRDVGDQRGQPVVVAEPDLVGGHRVVLVDHREHAQLKQPVQGALGVAVVRPAHQVIGAEQDLAGADAVPGEGRGVPGDEQALADAGRGLLGGQVAGAPGQAQRDQAGRDRPGGDQHDLGAGAGRAASGGGQGCDRLVGDLAVARW